MINLLPTEAKKQIRAARINVTLIKYFVFVIISAIFLALACIAVYVFLINNKPNETGSQATGSGQSDTSNYDSANSKYNTMATNFSTAKSILERQVSYSDIITSIGNAMPSGVILENLSLDNNKISAPISIQAKAKTTDDADKIKESFQNLPIFSNVNIQSVKSVADDKSGYPVSVTISLTINKGLSQ